MIRNLKALGLALVAVFAMSAMTASAASAAPALFTADSHVGYAGVHGGQIGAGDTFTIGALPPITCTTATLTGEAITAGTSSTYLKLSPTFHTCHFSAPLIGTRTITITMNECTYTFNATKNTNSTGTPAHPGAPTAQVNTPFSADLHIQCPANKQIEIHVYNTANHNDAGASTLCTFDIGPQTVLNQIQLTNTATHDIEAHVHANVVVTNTTNHGICGSNPNPTSVYKGAITGTATNSVGESVGSTVS